MSYPGAKGQAGTFQAIIGQMQPHSLYVELCAGSAQVFHRKRPAKESLLIDKNPDCFKDLVQSPAVRILLGDCLKLLPRVYLPEDAVIYCDPPYPLSTRQGRLYYDHEPESTDPDWHASLLTLLQSLRCRVLISGMPCPLYNERLKHWRCIQYRTRWHLKTVMESLWCNFPEPTELHDWRYAGQNFRRRTELKRMAARWLAKLEGLSPRDRGYLNNAIAQRQKQCAAPAPAAASGLTLTAASSRRAGTDVARSNVSSAAAVPNVRPDAKIPAR